MKRETATTFRYAVAGGYGIHSLARGERLRLLRH